MGGMHENTVQVSRLGRIFDPLVDKVIVCGTFVLLADRTGSAILPWMALVIVVRELVVTAIRAEMERTGLDFSAAWSGKLKMVFQCAAIGLELGQPNVARTHDWCYFYSSGSHWCCLAGSDLNNLVWSGICSRCSPSLESGLMTALVGLLATVVCLTSLFCVVKLLVRYRSGDPLLSPLPENPASWDGFDVASLFVLFIVCQALCVTVVQHFFPVGDATQVFSNASSEMLLLGQ